MKSVRLVPVRVILGLCLMFAFGFVVPPMTHAGCGEPPAAPSLVAPANDAMESGGHVDLSWSAVEDATSYRLEVDDSAAFDAPWGEDLADVSRYWPDGWGMCEGSYYWRVRAQNSCGSGPWSTSRHFTFYQLSPTPQSPADGVHFPLGSTVMLQANVGHGTYQVARDAAFSSLVVDQFLYNNEPCVVSGLAVGKYYWRASFTSQYCEHPSPWSPASTFFICPTAAPRLLTPVDGGQVTGTGVSLDWTDEVCATGYDVQVAGNQAFASPLVEAHPTISWYRIAGTMPLGTYYWRVRSVDGASVGPWTEARRFAVVEIEVTPTATLPAQGQGSVWLPLLLRGE